MRKIKLYIAASLNGKIATPDGSVQWLDTIPKPENGDFGYSKFYASVDTTIQGFSTYEQLMGWGIDFPYSEKKNYVLTRKQGLENTEFVEFISGAHIELYEHISEETALELLDSKTWQGGVAELNYGIKQPSILK